MEDVGTFCSPRKRSFKIEDNDISSPSNYHAVQSIEHSESFPTPPLTMSPKDDSLGGLDGTAERDSSPAASSSALSSIAPSTAEAAQSTPTHPTSGSGPPRKRRKLTVVEKEEQRKEKEAKDRAKAEIKAKKEEEKRIKEDEKQIKDEERRAKNETKEAKKREKELEIERRQQAEAKKNNSQLRLGAFFAKPQTSKATEGADATTHPQFDESRRKSLSLEPLEAMIERQRASRSPEKTTNKTQVLKSDYESYFLPFALPSHATSASQYISASRSQQEFDLSLSQSSQDPYSTRPHLSQIYGHRPIYRGLYQPRVPGIVASLQGSPQNPVDLTDNEGNIEHFGPRDLFDAVIVRHLHFAEDVRPPYSGSYTKITSPRRSAKIRRNPFGRTRTDTDYDYDSEAEWEEPEEGEDILSDGEEDAESAASENEMDGFVDDEEDAGKPKRKLVTSELQPQSTGLCWEDISGKPQSDLELRDLRLAWLIDVPAGSINPFSTSYWELEKTARPAPAAVIEKHPLLTQNGQMKPPRLPLQSRTSSAQETVIVGASSGMKGPIMAVATTKGPKTTASKLEGQLLEEFKEAVIGSNITKIELLKALKKRFPKTTNDTIKVTLESYFARVGAGAAEKRWKYIGD